MPHTEGRYMQDLGFSDARIRASAGDIIFTGATLAINRVAAGQWGVTLGTPAAQANTFAINVTQQIIRRLGFFEDTQNFFGASNFNNPAATAIPASAQTRTYRPDVIGAMSAAQQLQPRTAFKTKGFQLNSFDVLYNITTLAATSSTCRVDQTQYVNNIAPAITSILASGANGLQTAVQANPYVTNVPLAANQQIYRTLADTDLWIEVVITGQATTNLTFYGFDLYCEVNFN